MDDDIAGIDQHPVATGEALDAGTAMSGFLEGAQQMIGQRTDMPLGPPGSDDHHIGHGRFATQINSDDVFSLVIIQSFQDQ